MNQTEFNFGGATYDPEIDQARLNTALGRVWRLMRDGKPRTLAEIAKAAECSEAGASARLRDLRKEHIAEEFGVAAVNSERIKGGLWVYSVEVRR